MFQPRNFATRLCAYHARAVAFELANHVHQAVGCCQCGTAFLQNRATFGYNALRNLGFQLITHAHSAAICTLSKEYVLPIWQHESPARPVFAEQTTRRTLTTAYFGASAPKQDAPYRDIRSLLKG